MLKNIKISSMLKMMKISWQAKIDDKCFRQQKMMKFQIVSKFLCIASHNMLMIMINKYMKFILLQKIIACLLILVA